MDPAVHVALREPQPKEAQIAANPSPPFKENLVLVPDILIFWEGFTLFLVQNLKRAPEGGLLNQSHNVWHTFPSLPQSERKEAEPHKCHLASSVNSEWA